MRSIHVLTCSIISLAAACGSDTTEVATPSIAALKLDFGANQKTALLAPGTSASISTKVIADDGSTVASPAKVVFVSRNPSVVRVDDSGKATALVFGSAFVVGTLTVNGRTYTDSVNVVGGTTSGAAVSGH